MKTLFLLDGTPGTGKLELLQYIASWKSGAALAIPKYTTRSRRSDEFARQDLHFPPDTSERFNARIREPGFYWYTYRGDHHYGVYHRDIVEALASYDLVFLIVRNPEVAGQIKRALPDVQCVSIFMYSVPDRIEQRLRVAGYPQAIIDRILASQPLPWNEDVANATFYDDILVYDSDRRDFVARIEALISKWCSDLRDRLVFQLDRIDLALYQALNKNPELLRTLSWRQFERLLADILETLEYEVELQKGTKDGGIDIIAIKKSTEWGDHRYLLQAKQWSNRVGIEPVQRLLFLQDHLAATKACLATTSTFTRGAWRLARDYRWQLDLRDYDGLRAWIETALRRKARAQPDA